MQLANNQETVQVLCSRDISTAAKKENRSARQELERTLCERQTQNGSFVLARWPVKEWDKAIERDRRSKPEMKYAGGRGKTRKSTKKIRLGITR
jgi:hypothetical protein